MGEAKELQLHCDYSTAATALQLEHHVLPARAPPWRRASGSRPSPASQRSCGWTAAARAGPPTACGQGPRQGGRCGAVMLMSKGLPNDGSCCTRIYTFVRRSKTTVLHTPAYTHPYKDGLRQVSLGCASACMAGGGCTSGCGAGTGAATHVDGGAQALGDLDEALDHEVRPAALQLGAASNLWTYDTGGAAGWGPSWRL